MSSIVNNTRDVKVLDSNGKPAFNVVVSDIPPIDVSFEDNIEQDFADGNLSAVKAIYKTLNGVKGGDGNISQGEATIIGITRTSALDGDKIKYQIVGKFEDSSLNFNLNEALYLGTNGNITNIAPSIGYRTQLGHSLGNGAMFINIQEPIEL